MGGKGGIRLLVNSVQKTSSRLRVGSCDAIYEAHPQALFPVKKFGAPISLRDFKIFGCLGGCVREDESYEHVVSNFRLQMVFPNLVKELLLSRKVKGMDKRWRRVWSMLPLSLFWCMWRESNRNIFNEEELNNHMLKEIFIRSIGDAYLKNAEFNREPLLPKFRLDEPFHKPILKAEPSVLVQRLHPEDRDCKETCQSCITGSGKEKGDEILRPEKIERGVRRHFHDDITVVVLFLDYSLISRNSNRGPSLSIIAGGGVFANGST
ncbi:putative protein phosphatase 2C 38 [Vitis vinifera]|uniref:Uncharacterized protein n=1 Tax=Vitis vinifera TaxID=29760 RepID=A0A438CB77_VITVI|nr:putative protein phosphatase 2C 38 [Vitis vinifera]